MAVDGVELGQMARMQCQVALAPINSVGELDEALCIGEAVKAGVVLLEKGVVKPVIFKTFPLANAAAAHAKLERADHVGKIMLTV